MSRSFPGGPALAISASLHLLLIGALLYLPRFGGDTAHFLPLIAVDLLSPVQITPARRQPETPVPVRPAAETAAPAPDTRLENLPPVAGPPPMATPPVPETAVPPARPDVDAATIERLSSNLRRRLCIRLNAEEGTGADDCPPFTDDLTTPMESVLERAHQPLMRDAGALYGPKFDGLSLEAAGRRLGHLYDGPLLRFDNPREIDPVRAWDLATHTLGPLAIPKDKREPE